MLPKQPKGLLSLSIAAALSLSGFAVSTTTAQADAFTKALTGGKVKMDVRLRYEDVEDDSTAKDADLLTVRTRLGYQTGSISGFDAYVEMENTTAIGDDNDANTGNAGWGNGNGTYSVIADPEGTELNRYWLGYNGLADTVVRVGRQRIKLDNDRFIGNVGWRQNEQTYDSFTLTNKSLQDTTIFYAYLTEVNNILGSNDDMESHLVNVGYNGLGFGKLVGYGYFLDYDKESGKEVTHSSRTLGLRFKGATDMGGAKLLYTAEYAQQDDYKDGSNNIDYDYGLLKLGVKVSGFTIMAGYEQLEGDDNVTGYTGAFQTPLATLHGQNGWADMFLTTPAGGLEDRSIAISTKVAGIKLKAVYHDYEAESGSVNYGDEWNLVAVKKFGKNYTVLAKYAAFDIDNDWKTTARDDKDKLWLQAGFKF